MDDRMNKAKLLDTLRTARAQWDALLSEVDEARMIQPGVEGELSVKDIVAHVTWYERETAGVFQARALIGSELWALSQDERNAAVYMQNRGRSLQEVLEEAQEVFQQLLEAVQALAEEDIFDPHRFPGMPAEWQPWQMIASNSYEHYPQHIPAIRAWLDRQESP